MIMSLQHLVFLGLTAVLFPEHSASLKSNAVRYSGGKAFGNWTEKDILEHMENSTLAHMASSNCTAFFDREETRRFFNECSILHEEDKGRARREVGGHAPQPVGQDSPLRSPRERGVNMFINTENLILRESQGLALLRRVARYASAPVVVNRENVFLELAQKANSWRIMQLQKLQENPEIGLCILQKMDVLDTKGIPLTANIKEKVQEVLAASGIKANMLEEMSNGILNICMENYEKRLQSIEEKEDWSEEKRDLTKLKIAIRLVVCLSRESNAECKEAFVKKGASN